MSNNNNELDEILFFQSEPMSNNMLAGWQIKQAKQALINWRDKEVSRMLQVQRGLDRAERAEVVREARIDELEILDGLAFGQDFHNYQQSRLNTLRNEDKDNE